MRNAEGQRLSQFADGGWGCGRANSWSRCRNTGGQRSAYDKIRIRRSIEYPVCGVAVALRRDVDVFADLRAGC